MANSSAGLQLSHLSKSETTSVLMERFGLGLNSYTLFLHPNPTLLLPLNLSHFRKLKEKKVLSWPLGCLAAVGDQQLAVPKGPWGSLQCTAALMCAAQCTAIQPEMRFNI